MEMDNLTSGILLQKACSYQYQFCTKISKAGLSSSSDGLARYKEKAPDVSDSNQNV